MSHAQRCRIAGKRLRVLLFQRHAQDQQIHLRALARNSGAHEGQRALAFGHVRADQKAPAGLCRAKGHLAVTAGLCAQNAERPSPGTLSARGPVSGYDALRRTHHGIGCPVDGRSGADPVRVVVSRRVSAAAWCVLPDCPTWSATSPEDYVARAIALAQNPGAIEAYKTALRANRDTCLLFDMDRAGRAA